MTSENFKQWFSASSAARRFAVIAFLLCIGYYVLEWINGRAQMADFRVYYDAANAFVYDTPLYGKAFGVSSGFYKYSPFACIPFIPLALLPYAVASLLYYLLITSAIIWFSLHLTHRLILNAATPNASHLAGWALFFTSLFMADHLERELHLGNVNLFLLIGAYASFSFLKKGKVAVAGMIFGILLLFKPHFIILLPYFIWKKEWRALFVSAGSVVTGLLLPALIKGFEANKVLLAQWMGAIRDHNVKLEESPNTIYGILNHFVLQHSAGAWIVAVILALVAGLYLWFLLRNKRIRGNSHVRYIEYFVLIALIPNLAHTDTEHFMWTWPLIGYVILHTLNAEGRSKMMCALILGLAFIPYCVNSPDLVGARLRLLFDEGLMGVANLMIIGTAVWFYIHTSRRTAMSV